MSSIRTSLKIGLSIFLLWAIVFNTLADGWESYVFDLPSNVKESAWRDALAQRLNGQTEVCIDGGRIDVLTDTLAIEVDFPHKWHEGLGQALHYADATGKQGAVALIAYSQYGENLRGRSLKRFQMAEALYKKSGIKLLVLFPNSPRTDLKKYSKSGSQTNAPNPKFQFWLNSKSGIRHNSNCSFYETTYQGYHCGPNEGKPCSRCGG